MRVLSRLQRGIEGLHDVQTNLDVCAYIVDDATRAEIPGAREGLPEQLFVQQEEDEMALALYVAPKIIENLEADDPHRRLHGGNLEPFCIALEGVSHFVLVTHRAGHGRTVKPLELELQAEVDKFVRAWLILAEQGASLDTTGNRLIRRLFVRYEMRSDLPTEETDRYHVASRAAERFCRGLVRRHARRGTAAGITREVRGFYRRPLAEKMRAA